MSTAAPPQPHVRDREPAPLVAVATAIYAIAYLVWERAGWGSPPVRDLVGNVAFMPFNLTLALLLGRASVRPVLHPGVRRALRLLALGSLLVFLGNAISVYYVTVLRISPPVSWADPFYLADSVLIFVALLSFPLASRARHERWKFVLDSSMVLIGGGIAIWYFVVRPTAASGESDLVVMALAFAYPLVSFLILFGVSTVLLRRAPAGNRLAFGLVVGGIAISVVADLTFGLVQVDMGSRGASWTDAVYLLFYVMMIAGAERYARRPEAPAPGAGPEARIQPLSPLPYAAAAVIYALLFAAAVTPWTQPLGTLALGTILITLLMMARQVLAVRENVRLVTETTERRTEARFRSMVQHASDVIFVVSRDAVIRYASPSVYRVFGHHPGDVTDRPLADILHPDDTDQALALVQDAARLPGVSPPVEWRVRHPTGGWLHAETIATNLLDDPAVAGVVLNTRDVSDRKRLEQQLTHQAFHDSLTGLANRALFRDRVSHALTLAHRQKRAITVLFLDLDDFKKVNDSLGHSEGDRLLSMAADRFLACARSSDTVSRLGGDEFAILIEDAGAGGHETVVERLRAAMAEPFVLGGTEVVVNASIGIATAAGGETADDLLRNADVAMYAAKRAGKGVAETYQDQMYADAIARLEMESALRGAVERGELVVHYQPIVDLAGGAMHGVEALLRWDHPRLGLIPPQVFVPMAEETGLILRVGRWVLQTACQDLRRWRERRPADPMAVFVNLSSRQLHGPELAADLEAVLAGCGVPAGAIVLEITESVLMHGSTAALARLHALKALGVRLAIDDFGTGYSSLSYLQQFPIDILKIAKPFVDDTGRGVSRGALARAIIGLGATLHLDTIAEGVEREEQRAALEEFGCRFGQGHLFARPGPAEDIDALLEGRLPGTSGERLALPQLEGGSLRAWTPPGPQGA